MQPLVLLWVPDSPPSFMLVSPTAGEKPETAAGQVTRSSLSSTCLASVAHPPLSMAQLTFMRSRWCSNTLQVVCQVS